MRHIGFKNFRRFSDFPNMEFGDITILVGSNNSGKSTILKALMLVFDNLRNLNITRNQSTEGDNIFRFDGNNIHDVHIDTFWRALNNNAKETDNKTISFDLGIGEFSICIIVTGENNDRPEALITDIKIFHPHYGLTVDFNFANSTASVDFTNKNDKVDIRQEDIDAIIEGLRSELLRTTSAIEAGEINDRIDKLEKSKFAKDVLSSIGATVSLNELAALKNTVSDNNVLVQYLTCITRYAHQDTNGNRSSKQYKNAEADKSFIRNNESIIGKAAGTLSALLHGKPLEYIYAHGATQKAVYSFEDKNDYTARTIYQFLDQKINPGSDEYEFVTSWMKKFGVGVDFKIDSMRGTAYGIRIYNVGKDKEGVELADKGMGSNQLMILLWKMASFISMYKDISNPDSKPTIIIEEPEQNLHPKIQSLLADLFMYLNDKYGFRFIIETHSEYLVRRSQVIVNSMQYQNLKEAEEKNPFRVYYIQEKGLPYEMKYRADGKFSNEFGTGFFDEASNLAFEIF